MQNTAPRREKSVPLREAAGKKQAVWGRLAEGCGLSLLAILVLEIGFRLFAVGGQEYLQPDMMLGCKHIASKQVIWRLEGFSNDRLSSTGLRDVEHAIEKPPGVIRIALLGDSSTEGMQVALEETYGRVLEKMLNHQQADSRTSGSHSPAIACGAAETGLGTASAAPQFEVMNFACASYATAQQLLQFETQVVKYDPDIVVLLYNRSDALENVYSPGPGALAQPRPYYYLTKQKELQQDNRILDLCANKLKPNECTNFLRKYSRTYGVLDQMNLTLTLYEPMYRRLTGWIGKLDRTSSKLPVVLSDNSPLELTKAIVTKLARAVHEQKAKFVFLVFPNATGDLGLLMESVAFKTLSEQEHFGFLDLTDAFSKRQAEGKLFLQYHFSALGHRVVAEQLAPMLEKKQSAVDVDGNEQGPVSTTSVPEHYSY